MNTQGTVEEGVLKPKSICDREITYDRTYPVHLPTDRSSLTPTGKMNLALMAAQNTWTQVNKPSVLGGMSLPLPFPPPLFPPLTPFHLFPPFHSP